MPINKHAQDAINRQDEMLEENQEACKELYGIEAINHTLQPTFSEILNTWICPPFFDGIACWPPTPANTTAIQECPTVIIGFLKNQNATRYCTENGTWFTKNDMPWTNYTQCSNDTTATIYQELSPFNVSAEEEFIARTTKILARTGYSISFISLIIAFLIMFSIKKLHCPRNILHMNLFVSFILRAFVSILKDILFIDGLGTEKDILDKNGFKYFTTDLVKNNFECKLISSILQYCVTANYFWLLMEGIYLNNLIFRALFADSSRNLTYYIICGWGLPILIVVPWVIGRIYVDDTLCWTTMDNYWVYLIIAIPTSASILINFVLFVIISVVLYSKLRSPINEDSRRYLKWAKSTLVLIPLFGAYYFLGLIFQYIEQTYYFWLISDMAFGSFQGFLVAVLYCFLNGEVKSELKPYIQNILIFLATNELFRYCFPCRQRYLRSAVGRQSVCTTTMSCSSLYANNILHRNSRSSKWDLFSKNKGTNINEKLTVKDHTCTQKQSSNLNGHCIKDSVLNPHIVETSLCIEKNMCDSAVVDEEISMLSNAR